MSRFVYIPKYRLMKNSKMKINSGNDLTLLRDIKYKYFFAHNRGYEAIVPV